MASFNTARVEDDRVVEMGHLNIDSPENVIVWKIDIDVKNNEISLDYVEAYKYRLAQDQTIEEYIKILAKEPDTVNGPKPGIPKPDDTKTNLSIRFKEQAHMVFVLTGKNWQFSEEKSPFKVETGNDNYYMAPQCAWLDNGTPVSGKVPPKAAYCRVATFVANSLDDMGGSATFSTSFNIYVDFILKRTDHPTKRRLLPIIIDPDVGHPGGAEP